MSKSKKRVQRHTRYFIELSTQRKLLILKRGRLTRTGEAISVAKLDSGSVGAKSWLQANLPKDGTAIHPWDVAHQLANKVRQDLGELPYVEPEINSGQVGLFRDVMKERARETKDEQSEESSSDEVDELQSLDHRSFIPDPMEQMTKLLPNLDFGLPAASDPSLPGFNTNNRDRHVAINDGVLSSKKPSKGSKLAGQGKTRRFVFPLMHALSGWNDLPASLQKMLEVEMVQVYRGAKLRAEHPRLELDTPAALSSQETVEIFDELQKMPMSKRLKNFLCQRKQENLVCN